MATIPRRRWRTIAWAAALAPVVIYVLVVATLTAVQGSFFFHPNPTKVDLAAANLSGFQAVTLTADDGERLVGWWRPPDPGFGSVLYLHGNGDNHSVRAGRLRDLAAQGFGVLAIDYRGYGGSTGAPSEQGLYRDARASWRFLAQQTPDRPVAIFGESLGTAVAIQLATEVGETGVVLDSPLSSMTRLVRRRTPWFPLPLVRDRFDSASKVDRIGSPLLVVHCEADATAPFDEGRRLFQAAREPKRFIALPGCGHVQIWREPAKAQVLTFLRERLETRAIGR